MSAVGGARRTASRSVPGFRSAGPPISVRCARPQRCWGGETEAGAGLPSAESVVKMCGGGGPSGEPGLCVRVAAGVPEGAKGTGRLRCVWKRRDFPKRTENT